jgi:hypothetical protein
MTVKYGLSKWDVEGNILIKEFLKRTVLFGSRCFFGRHRPPKRNQVPIFRRFLWSLGCSGRGSCEDFTYRVVG